MLHCSEGWNCRPDRRRAGPAAMAATRWRNRRGLGAGMVELYRKIFCLLTPGERRMFLLLMPVMLLVALAEIAGLSSVLLLLNVLSDPEAFADRAVFSWVRDRAGLDNVLGFQLLLSVGAIVVILVGLAIKSLGSYAVIRFAQQRGRALSTRMLASYLGRPYVFSLTRNTAEMARSVLNDTMEFTGMGLTPALQVVVSAVTAAVIVGFLLVVDPLIAVVAAVVIGVGYGGIYLWLRHRLQATGREAFIANTDRFRVAQEATGGFKEVKLLGLEREYAVRFDNAAARLARSRTRMVIMTEMPRLALEGLTFVLLVGIVLILLVRGGGSITAIIPTLGVYVFASMRLMPALQQVYHGAASLRSVTAVVERLAADSSAAVDEAAPARLPGGPRAQLPFRREVVLDRVRFAYPSAVRPALEEVSLSIPTGATVGIVGGTGAGKTTLVDLILGLLTPDGGEIRIDGTRLGPDTLRAWQHALGYVPQAIYLTDDTVTGNIAFGIPPEQVDREAVIRAARIAALHDFVTGELPQGYDTVVGERGVRLSGGQRQRIGIARALYHDPAMLVFDEATSALDTLTERVVMEAVHRLRRDKTVILIAHRLSTVRDCDVIYLMERGSVVASGTFDELVAGSETFRRMATGT